MGLQVFVITFLFFFSQIFFSPSILALEIKVNTTQDRADANCTREAGHCSPRAAILLVNQNPNQDHVIQLESRLYVLSLAGPDEDHAKTGDLDIKLGSGSLTVKGNGATIDGGGGPGSKVNSPDRVFHIHSGRVFFNDITIQNGRSKNGGGLLSEEEVASLNFYRCTFRGNRVESGGLGGGAVFLGNRVIINQCSFHHNKAGRSAIGAALYVEGDGVSILNSTFSDNEAARGEASVVFLGSGNNTMAYTTLLNNDATQGNFGLQLLLGSDLLVKSSLLISSHPNQKRNCDIASGAQLISAGYNLNNDPSCALIRETDQLNVPNFALRPLSFVGGPTRTNALLAGSSAIDGSDCYLPGGERLEVDQRGFKRWIDGNFDGERACDIGAVEYASHVCGDGFRQVEVEECDNGRFNSDTQPNACRTNCRHPYCGDGVKDFGEGCDDGNARDEDGCSSDCEIE